MQVYRLAAAEADTCTCSVRRCLGCTQCLRWPAAWQATSWWWAPSLGPWTPTGSTLPHMRTASAIWCNTPLTGLSTSLTSSQVRHCMPCPLLALLACGQQLRTDCCAPVRPCAEFAARCSLHQTRLACSADITHAAGREAVLASATAGASVRQADVYQDQYIVALTDSSLLLLDWLTSAACELPWQPGAHPSLWFEYPEVRQQLLHRSQVSLFQAPAGMTAHGCHGHQSRENDASRHDCAAMPCLRACVLCCRCAWCTGQARTAWCSTAAPSRCSPGPALRWHQRSSV